MLYRFFDNFGRDSRTFNMPRRIAFYLAHLSHFPLVDKAHLSFILFHERG